MGLLLQITTAATDTLAAAATTPVTEKSLTLWELAEKGGPILYPIALLSILALYIFFERLFVIIKFSRLDNNFMNQIRDQVHAGNVAAARTLCKGTDNPIARMIEKGLSRLGKPVREIEANSE